MRSRVLLFFACVALFSIATQAADWPQWRGPNRDGISRETGLLKEWPKDGPKLIWHAKEIGQGYSTPAVVGNRLYIMSNQGTDDEFVQAINVADGNQVWSTRVGKVGPNRGPQYPGARSTPTVDGPLTFALGSDGDLACLNTSDGKIRWQKNLRTDFGGKTGNWAYAESPLVDGDNVVVTPGGEEATILALDKKSGDVAWKSAIPGGDEAAYASIVTADIGGVKQYVQFVQKGVVGVDAKTGKFLWRYEKTAKGSPANIPTPVTHSNFVYTGTGRGGGGLAKVNSGGDGFEAEEIYFSAKLPTAIGGAVLLDGHLYGTSSGGIMCVDFATGDVKWQERGVGAGSLCYADGRLYVHGESGDVALVEATPQEYRELGKFTPPDQPERARDAKAWAYPVVANGRLYIRDATSLWCFDVKGGSSVQ
jgi:outer membrane protein assembly factor BamB